MKVLIRGKTKTEEKFIGICNSCKSIIEAEHEECWWSNEIICPLCYADTIKMYLETSIQGIDLRNKVAKHDYGVVR